MIYLRSDRKYWRWNGVKWIGPYDDEIAAS
jgi:hypothetical protein